MYVSIINIIDLMQNENDLKKYDINRREKLYYNLKASYKFLCSFASAAVFILGYTFTGSITLEMFVILAFYFSFYYVCMKIIGKKVIHNFEDYTGCIIYYL